MIIYIITYFCLLYEVITKSKKSIHLLEETLYNRDNLYLKWLKQHINKSFLHIDILSLFLFIIGFFFSEKTFKILCIIVSIIVIFDTEILKYNIMIENTKKPLIYTKRIIRLIITLSIINILPLLMYFIFKIDMRISLIIESIFLIFNYLVVFLSNVINTPIEKIIYHKNIILSEKKINNIDNLSVIAISGSYGKTSCKNIINDVLKSSYKTVISNDMDIVSTINNLDNKSEVLITEIPSYKDMSKTIFNLIKPKYAILTSIGLTNLDSFNNIDNIIKENLTLIEELDNNGIAFLNKDDPYQVNYKLKKKIKVIWYATNNKEADFYVTKYECSSRGSKFRVYIKEIKKEFSFETKLLGSYNISNLVGCIALCYTMGININKIIKIVKSIKPFKNTLELKRLDNINIIYDTCHSNEVGFMTALDILSMMSGTRVVVTPGLFGLGREEDNINKRIGKKIGSTANYVILIGKKSNSIEEGLLENGFSKDNIIKVNDERQTLMLIKKLKSNNNMYVLYENDLPDIYKE